MFWPFNDSPFLLSFFILPIPGTNKTEKTSFLIVFSVPFWFEFIFSFVFAHIRNPQNYLKRRVMVLRVEVSLFLIFF